jgi:hypothetical protein
LFEDLGLALDKDFLGGSSVASASAFHNADSPECAADDPIGRLWPPLEFEGHGKTSYK